MIYLWLDDIRNPWDEQYYSQIMYNIMTSNFDLIWVKSYEDFVDYVRNFKAPDIIDFDHDLGLNEDGTEKNGYDCAKFIAEYCLDNGIDNLPKFIVHSSNPVGRENIMSVYNTLMKIYGND